MKKSVLKGIFFGVVLFLALFAFETLMNQGNTDMTAEMAPASMPLVYMNISGEKVNCLHGYQMEMEAAYMRDTITPLESGRDLGVEVEKYGQAIRRIGYEVRSGDGSRLIEDTQITDYTETDQRIIGFFTIKDLIEAGKEYNLIVKIELTSGQSIRYYTRILYVEDYHVVEKLNYVKKFHEDTFDKIHASDNLAMYLEPNSAGDNSTFQKVNIHSSLDQVTWGDLQVKQETDPVIDIKEMMQQTASFKLSYQVAIRGEDSTQHYLVKEYFRIRYTPDRIYLLDYEREMSPIFDENGEVYYGDKIALGIQNPDNVQLLESDGGELFAFVDGGKLLSYNVTDQKMALLFGFAREDQLDARTLYDSHQMKILNVDETGNVQFVVYGYMNRGRHEGENGVQVNRYNSGLNTIEEIAFIPYTKSPQLLQAEMDKLSYAGNNRKFYMMVDSTVYELDLDTKACRIVENNMSENRFEVSGEGKMLVWCSDENYYQSSELTLMNMKTGRNTQIKAGFENYIMPLGFMGDDLIYGLARKSQVTKDLSGRVFYPMHTICIQDEKDNLLKKYQEEDIYILSLEVLDNQIILHRMERDAEEEYFEETTDDQIMNSQKEAVGKNKVESMVVDTMETVVQIAVKNDINKKELKFLTPKEVLFEGENQVSLPKTEKVDRYYVYSVKGLTGAYTDASEAVERAYDAAGVVLNDTGACLWYKGNRVVRNQIMKITGEMADESRGQLATCLDTILSFENVNRSTQFMLDRGKNTLEILAENIPDIQVLDLTGCSLDAILYYVNQDIPVLATLEEEQARLVIGFNELNIVVMDPEDGTVYKVGMNDATEMFAQAGNRFVTYSRIVK